MSQLLVPPGMRTRQICPIEPCTFSSQDPMQPRTYWIPMLSLGANIQLAAPAAPQPIDTVPTLNASSLVIGGDRLTCPIRTTTKHRAFDLGCVCFTRARSKRTSTKTLGGNHCRPSSIRSGTAAACGHAVAPDAASIHVAWSQNVLHW